MKKHILILLLTTLTYAQAKAQIEVPSLKKGIVFQANDNSFKAKLGFRMQNLIEHDFETSTSDAHTNMLVRRFRIKLDGFIHNPKFVYKFEMGISNRDIGASSDFAESGSASKLILDAVLKYKAHKNMEFWFGQTKLPGNRERVISSQKLQFVDRSLVNSNFTLDRDMGVQMHLKKELGKAIVKIKTSFSMGEGRNITKGNYGGFDYTGRFEILPFGEFTKKGDYFSSDLEREKKPKLAIGATYDINKDASRQGGQLKSFVLDTMENPFYTDLSTLFIDMIFKYKGLSIQSEYANKLGDSRAEDGTIDPSLRFRTGSGLNVQMGYLFKNNIELAGRFTNITPDASSSLQEVNEYTLGLSKFIVGHTLKVQTDFSMSNYPGTINGDNSFRWRFQLELGF